MIHYNRKKIILIGVYLILLAIVWFQIKGKVTESYDDTGIIKSFGTVLRDDPEVAQAAITFRAVRPSKRRKLPTNFPGHLAWEKFMSPIGNQGHCGSCWAWGTSYALADRFAILSDGKLKVQLSPAKMVMCTFRFDDIQIKDITSIWGDVSKRRATAEKMAEQLKTQISCAGNNLYSAVRELYIFGTTTESCVPYVHAPEYDFNAKAQPTDIPNCWDIIGDDFDQCVDGSAMRIFRALDIYTVGPNEDDIMQEIYRWGPVTGGFKVYQSFMTYDGKSIYTGPKSDKSGNIVEDAIGGHAVRIVGWGEDKQDSVLIKYWWIANSWSEKWGDKGYFRMKKGIKECDIESNIVAMKPDFPGNDIYNISNDIVEDVDKALREFPGHFVDPDLLYYRSAVEKVNNSSIRGDLNVLLKVEDLPAKGDFKNFWAADYASGYALSSESSGGGKISTGMLIVIFLVLAVIGIVGIRKMNIE